MHQPPALLEAFEPRILYSADLAAVLGSAADGGAQAAHVQLLQTPQEAPSLRQIAFVDAAIPDAQSLIAGLQAPRSDGRVLEVITIAPGVDGLAVISSTLQARNDIAAIHLFSHGSAGQVQLGTAVLDENTAVQRAPELAAWGSALTTTADLLIYGCDVASTPAGQDLLTTLGALTGADVAASSDATGAAPRGGNWLLEVHSGSIETTVAANAALQQAWAGLLGNEFAVNTTTPNDQTTAALTRGSQQAVAVDAAGNYVVVWTSSNQDGSGDGVYARRFAWDGTPLSSEIQVNTTTAGDQNQARVAADAAGNFVVVWSGDEGGGNGTGVYLRRFAADGTAVAAEVQVNTFTAGAQTNPVIGMNRATGDFVVAWEGQGSTDTGGISFRRYSAAGAALDSTQRAGNVTDNGTEIGPAVAMDSSGRVVVAFEVSNHMYFQRFDASGAAAGTRTQVDNALSNSTGASIAMDAAGNFTLAYREEGSLAPGVWGRGFMADGSQRYTWYYADSGDATSPSIAMDGDGAFVVTYQKSGSSGTDVLARKYNANGSPNGAAFAASVDTSGAQQAPSVAVLGKDDFVIVWSGKTPSDSSGVMARTFEAPAAAPVITSDGGSDSASLQVVEGSTTVTTVTASDSNLPAQTLTYSIETGADAARFAIDASSGVLRFVSPPTFASPADADANNVYDLVVAVSDGTAFDKQTLSVTVLSLAQAPLAQPDSYALAEDQAFSATVASGWYDAAWTVRHAISLNNASGPALTDTVVLVTLDSSTVDYSRTQNSGQDLRFVSSSGQLLAHEIESWDEAGTSRVWVRVPSIAAATTSSIWMYHGNASAADGQQVTQTWPAGTSAVVHMTSTLDDATASNNTVTQSGTTVTTGALGPARQFDGATSWVSLGSAAVLDDLFLGGGTFTAWINPSGWGEGGYGRIASKADSTFASGSNGNGWNLQLNGSSQSLLFEIGFGGARGGWNTPSGSIALNTWQQVTVVYDNTAAANVPRIFINGAEMTLTRDGTPSGAPTTDAAVPLRIGNQALTTDRAYAGRIDEVRVYDTARSAAQVAADYRASAGTLVASVGAAQMATPGVLNNDDARSGGAMSAELVAGPAHASSFTFNADGTFSYTPAANYHGSDGFSYRARNSAVATDPVLVSLAITSVADAPVISTGGGAASTTVSVAEGSTAVATLAASDADGPSPALAWSITGGADAAQFVVDGATGVLRFATAPRFDMPADADANNVYDVVVQVSDGGLADSLTLAVSVTDVQHAPVALNDAYAVIHNTPLNVPASEGLLSNDSDADGELLSVLSVTGPAHGTLSLTPAALSAFTNLSNNGAVDTRPAWSPDATRIAFDSARDGNNEIYVMAANGSGATRLTNNAADDSQAAWSPDGTRIAFMSNRDGNYDLWVMNAADGSGLVQLAATPSGISGQPAWSPDGSRLAFTSNRSGGSFDVYVVNVDGSGLTRLTNTAGNDDEPAWSTDGTRLAFTSARDGNSEIYVMNADGSGQTRLTNNAATDRSPDWSRFDDQLSFVSDRSGTQQIVVMGGDGVNPVAVTSDPAGVSFADWSPDGRQLVFASAGEIQSAAIRFPGGFFYTPTTGYGGSDSFSYTVADNTGQYSTASVTLTVQGAAAAAVDDAAATGQPLAVTVDVLANDTTGPGGPLQLLDVSAPAQGTATIVSNELVYTPTVGTSGTDTVRYLITDGGQQLVHYWKLDGDASDSVGGAGGVLLNGPASTTGVYGSALQFDGVDDHAQLTDVNYNNEFTLSFWFKLADNNGTGYRYLYSHGSEGTPDSVNVFFIEDATTTALGAQNVLRTRLLDNNDADNFNGLDLSASTLADNTWHQYTLTTITGLGARVYIDGSLRATISSGGDAINPVGNVRLGGDDTLDAARFLDGSLDGVALFSRGLSVADVQAHAGGGAHTATLTVTVSPAPQTAPVIVSDGGGATATRTVPENTAVVTTVQALDSDLPAQTVAYSITGGADAARFQIRSDTGALSFITAPNFEAPDDTDQDGVYEVQVQASDGTLSDSQTINVQLSDQNEFSASSPVDSNTAAEVVPETATIGSTVGLTARSLDADGSNNTVSYSLDNSASGRFAIDPVSGVVRVAAALDAEAARNHLVTVRATSSDGSWSVGSFNIAVQDTNEFALSAVSDTDAAANAVSETAPAGTTVGLTAWAFDADASTNLVNYTFGDNAGGRFAIDSSTGVVSLARALGEEGITSHRVTVLARSADGSSSSQSFDIAVLLANDHPPVMTSLGGAAAATVTVDENQAVVLTLSAADADLPAQTLVYSISGGADASRFQIRPDTGALVFVNAPDFEAPDDADLDGLYEVQVQVSDGTLTDSQSISVQRADINEFSVSSAVDTNATTTAVAETAPAGTAVGLTAWAVDGDGTTNQVSYTLSDSAGGRFSIDSSTGVVSLARVLGEEGITSHSVTVLARSADGSASSQAFDIAVLLANDHPPLFTSLDGALAGTVAIDENQALVLTLSATDADLPAQALRFSLAGGADAALFSVDASTGALRFVSAPDFERPLDADGNDIYELVAAVSDGGMQSLQSVSVQVRNVPEAPRWLGNTLSISEGSSAVPSVAVADEDTAPADLNLLVQGLQGGHFEYAAAPGVVVTVFTQDEAARGAIRFVADGGEAAPTYSLVLSDATHSLPPQAAVVTFTPVNDAPVITAPVSTTLRVPENTMQVTQASATDADSPASGLRFSLAPSGDAALFNIDAGTGALAFRAAPDHEQALDANADGTYELVLSVSDGAASTLLPLTVQVSNVDEAPTIGWQKLVLSDTAATLDIQATDPDGPATALSFEVLSTQGGRFEWQAGTAQAGTAASLFTQDDMNSGRVRFVLAAGGQPSFQLALTDGVNRVLLGAPQVEKLAPTAAPAPVGQTAPAAAAPTTAPVPAPVPITGPAPVAAPAPSPAAAAPAPPVVKAESASTPVVAEQRPVLAAEAPVVASPRKPEAPPPVSAPADAPAIGSFWGNGLGVLTLPSESTPLLREPGATAESAARSNSSLAHAMDSTRAQDPSEGPTAIELGSAGTVLVSSGLSVGYVLWLVRGGVLAASVMSSVPAWTSVDPLPVLSQMRRRGDTDEANDDGDGSDQDPNGEGSNDFDPIERLFSRARRLVPRGAAGSPPPEARPAAPASPLKEEASAWAS